ncbi:hypothetical protein ACHAO4_007634 [Trichoderma viride]
MSLEPIRYASASGIHRDDSKRMDGLPSWCPDWTLSIRERIFLETQQQDTLYGSRYAASGQTKADPVFPTEQVLSVKGILCDAITLVGCGSSHVSGPGSDPKALQQWCHLVAHSPSVHRAICDECDKTIYGIRHKCLVCPDFDLCSKCFSNSGGNHLDHSFTTISSELRGFKDNAGNQDQAPAIVITALENGFRVQGSSWEKLKDMDYPFSEGDTIQNAFRKVLVSNLSLLSLNEDGAMSEVETEPLLQEIAFNEFWSVEVENRPAVAIPIKEGYTAEQVDCDAS